MTMPVRGDTARLRGVQVVLALLIAAWLLIGRTERFWPVVGWPMYDSISPVVPADIVSRVYVRVRLHDGTRRVLRQADLVEYSRAPVAGLTIDALLDRNDAQRQAAGRAHLTALVARALGRSDIDSIALSRTAWSVVPERVPPVRLEQPVSTVPIVAYEVPR